MAFGGGYAGGYSDGETAGTEGAGGWQKYPTHVQAQSWRLGMVKRKKQYRSKYWK